MTYAPVGFRGWKEPGGSNTSVLTYLYLFSLIVGGILLASSILLGGKDIDADADVDADLDLDADGDLEAEAEGFDKDVGGHGDVAGFLYLFLSLRFWIFFMAFFGLTGIVIDLLGLASQWVGFGAAVTMGLGTGLAATSAIRWLAGDTSARTATSSDYVGKTARVLVPMKGEAVGKVRVDIRGQSVDLLATGIEPGDFAGKEEVLIVEMDGPRARVARLDTKSKAG